MLLTGDMKCMLASLSFQSFWELDANWISTSSPNKEGEFKMKITQINAMKKLSLYFSTFKDNLLDCFLLKPPYTEYIVLV